MKGPICEEIEGVRCAILLPVTVSYRALGHVNCNTGQSTFSSLVRKPAGHGLSCLASFFYVPGNVLLIYVQLHSHHKC